MGGREAGTSLTAKDGHFAPRFSVMRLLLLLLFATPLFAATHEVRSPAELTAALR